VPFYLLHRRRCVFSEGVIFKSNGQSIGCAGTGGLIFSLRKKRRKWGRATQNHPLLNIVKRTKIATAIPPAPPSGNGRRAGLTNLYRLNTVTTKKFRLFLKIVTF